MQDTHFLDRFAKSQSDVVHAVDQIARDVLEIPHLASASVMETVSQIVREASREAFRMDQYEPDEAFQRLLHAVETARCTMLILEKSNMFDFEIESEIGDAQ